jgi:hypothetical protein
MVDFPKFFATAGELYNLWPALFNWAVPAFFSLLGIVAIVSWWMCSYRANTAQALMQNQMNGEISELKIEIVGLKGEINVLTRHLTFAAQEQKAAVEHTKKVEAELAEYKAQAAKGAGPKELQLAVKEIENSVKNLITANNLVTSTLNFIPGSAQSTLTTAPPSVEIQPTIPDRFNAR